MNNFTQMYKKYFLLIGLMFFVTASFSQNRGLVEGKIRIKINTEVLPIVSQNLKATLNSTGIIETGISRLDLLNKEFKVVKMKRVFPYSGKHESKHIKHGLNQWYELELDSSTDLRKASNKFLSSSEVVSAEPVYSKTLGDSNYIKAEIESTLEEFPTNDPGLYKQWHYNNTGEQEGFVEGNDINLFEAWETTMGSRDVIVAIVDGGIDVNHSDLKDNIWVNEIELNGTKGVDDDNNGYIDDINGFNFQAYKGEITPHFHGTHVAGTVSAVNNNGIGVAGIAGGSGNGDGARLMSCQIFNEKNESGSFAAAIVYGADNGAVISQNSWGYSKPGAVEQVVLDAIDYFREEAGNYPGSPMKGGVLFFAAGNDGQDNVYYPGYYDGVISVAATGPSNVKSGYSNFGEWVDVAAPGGDQNFGLEAMILSTIPGEEYGFLQGTSMACPHISGVAALVVAKYGSEYFTNVDLESRILQGVNNIDASNPSYIGKIGSGLSDASKALTSNESTPPDGITDISVVGVSKDFAVLTWTVPTDPDDETPNKYFLYWSENNISEDSLSKIDFVVVNNNGNNVGDYIMAEVKGLKELTKYNFVAVASDRWGNTSELSKTVTTTTNEGSEIGTDLPSLSLDVDVSTSTQGGGTFHVLNQNDGILKWKLEQRNVRHTKSFSSVSYPINAKTITTSSALGKKEILKTEEVETVPYAQLQWVPSSIKYWTLTYPSYLFGSVDTTYTNSMATRFEINDEEGFNLTHVNAMLRGDAEDGPFIIEIYKGSAITDENRIYFDDEYYQLENNGENVIYRRIVELKENIFFNKDDVFWIVFHSPSNNKYPFGVYPETIESYSDNCIWSTDMGNTWVPLDQGMGSPDFVWGIDLVSSTDPLYKYVTVNPDKGELYGVDQQEIDFAVDATKLINGTYYSNMVFISNDELNPFYRVPLTVEVSGHKPLLSGPSIVEFGRVFNGLKKELRIPLNNGGYGKFNTKTATSSDTQFKVVSSIGNINIDGLSSKDIKIEYTPNGIGNDNAEITLTSKNGDVYSFNVFGIGAAPAKIEIQNTVFNFDNVTVGDELTATITIKNIGQYPLQYGFPTFADDLSNIEEVDLGSQSLGYSYDAYDYPIDFVFNDISETGTDLTSYFTQNPEEKVFKLDLGFEFPYFGKSIDSLFITPNGVLALNENGSYRNTLRFMNNSPDGYIAGLQIRYPVLNQSGKISYKRELGFTTVQYTKFRESRDYSKVDITFQIILFDNGNIKFVYDKMDGIPSSSQTDYYSAIESEGKRGGLELNGLVSAKKIIDIHTAGTGIVKSISEPTGIISTGASKDITVTLDHTKLPEGVFTEKLYVMSNDPFTISKEILINVNVTNGGESSLTLNTNSISVGDVINNTEVKRIVEITNNGDKLTEIVSALSVNTQSGLLNSLPLTIKPGQVMYAEVSINTDNVVAINDVLKLTDSDGGVYSINITGNIIDAPQISLSNTEYNEVLEVNEVVRKDLTIENNDEGTLEYSFVNAGLAYIEPNVSAKTANSDIPEFTYVTKTTYKNDDVPFRWYTVGEENQFPFRHKEKIYWADLELPFEFEFYDKKYSTLYVNMQGVVSFTEPSRRDVFMFPGIPAIGEDDYLNNYIAPYFAGQDLKDYDYSGVYYKVFGDKLVIEWKNLIDRSSVGVPYSFQLILHKNGLIKFQYSTYYPQSASITNLGYIGIENEDASEYLLLAGFSDFAKPGVAAEIIPSHKEILAPGQSKSYDVVMDATNQFGGDHNQHIGVFSNSPLNEYTEIDVNISISGEPEISFDESRVDLGEVFISENPITSEYAINVKNDGLKELRISNIHLEHYDDIIIQYLYKHPFFGTAWKTIGGILNPSYSILPEGILENELRLVFTPTDSKYLNTPYRNKVIFKTNYGTYSANLNIVANYSLPPVFTVMTDSIYHIANSNDIITDKVVLGNVEGQANLKYSVSLDYQRVSSVSSSLSTAVNNSVLSSVGIDVEKVVLQNINEEEFYRVLSYEDNLAADSRLGFNGLYIFSAGTAFTAPEEGFKLSHVQTWYVPDTMLESDIDIEIRAGADIQTAAIIHTQTVQHSITETDGAGSLLTYELDKEITLLPYERFYVIFSYPIEVLYPQGFAQVDDSELTKTFYVYDGIDTWIDLSATSFNKAHYIIRAAQKDAENLQWIEIDEPIGVVAKGGTKDLTFKMFPKNVSSANNNVNLVISTNDPINISESVNVVLRINQGPEVVLEDEYSVREADTLSIVIPVVDIEGDEIVNVKLAKDYATASLSYDLGEAKFNYIPTYDDEGLRTFEIETSDALGIISLHQINVDVENVNRAPVVIDDSVILIDTDNPEYKNDFTNIFKDLDGQEMTFTVEIENDNIAEIFVSDDGIVVKPIKTGFTRLNLTATDIDGASVSLEKVVVVNSVLGIDDIFGAKWEIYPNPVDNVLMIELREPMYDNVKIRIFNLAGVIVKFFELNENNNIIKNPISDLESGVYLLELSSSEGKSTKKMIKN